jgi:3-hydroxyisobutyrate dehydrogenase-like beta-hydroxyacid dehydrogenase
MGTETPIAPIGVIGGGTMGRSIASHLVARGKRNKHINRLKSKRKGEVVVATILIDKGAI